jgi:hypothetical protein
MSDHAIANALRRRIVLQNEIEEIDLFVRLHQKFSGSTNPEREVIDAERRPAIDAPVDIERGRKRGRPADFADQMELVLTEVNRPLSRPEMVEELERRGVDIPSEDKPRYLGTILWRHRDRFRNLQNFGYWVRSIPYPKAGYDPATDTESDRLLDEEPISVERPDDATSDTATELFK